ncbi:MAG: hypothetical protein H7834_05595 [Magnetococcus sp. YQC-9]
MSDKQNPDDRELDHSERIEQQEALPSLQSDGFFAQYFDKYVELGEIDDDILDIKKICHPKYRDPIARREGVAILTNERVKLLKELDLLEAAEQANEATPVSCNIQNSDSDAPHNNYTSDSESDIIGPKQRKENAVQRNYKLLGMFLAHLVKHGKLDPAQLPFNSVEFIDEYNKNNTQKILNKAHIGGYISRGKPTLISILGCSEIEFSRSSHGGGAETIKSILEKHPFKIIK